MTAAAPVDLAGRTILQVIPALEAGGAERTTVEIAAAIVKAGGRALVATRGGRLAGEVEAAGGETFALPVHAKNPVTIIANARRLGELIRREGVDLVHARSRAPAWSALLAARRAGRAFVTTYHGAYRLSGPVKRLLASSMVRGDRIIANSSFTARMIAETYPWAAARIVVIPRGADTTLFDPAAVDAARIEAVRDAWGLSRSRDEAPFVVLMPARLSEWKGHALAVEAAALLKARGLEKLRLVFVGDGEGAERLAGEIDALIATHDLDGVVLRAGHAADMPAAYAASDVVLSASTRPEAFGRTLAEAGAMGLPCVAAAHGGALETLSSEETGFLFQPGDARSLADAMARLMGLSDEARRAMGAHARARVSAHFSIEAMAAATLRLYDELLSGGAVETR